MNKFGVHVPQRKSAECSKPTSENLEKLHLGGRPFSPLFLVLLICLLSPSHLPVVQAAEREDVYIGLYFLSSFPVDHDARLNGNAVADTNVANGFGAGFKAGIFPDFTKRMIGVELESLGHNSEISFRSSFQDATSRTNLWIFGTMLNLVLRVPLQTVIPYIGIGAGLSQGVLSHADIPGRADRDFETSPALGHQFFAGVQADLNRRVFCFGEYKYLAANYHWEGLSLDFRSHYALIGVGLRF
jgi:opacity protein-like surface antigen